VNARVQRTVNFVQTFGAQGSLRAERGVTERLSNLEPPETVVA